MSGEWAGTSPRAQGRLLKSAADASSALWEPATHFPKAPSPCGAEVSQDDPPKRCTLSNVVLTQWVNSRCPEPLQGPPSTPCRPCHSSYTQTPPPAPPYPAPLQSATNQSRILQEPAANCGRCWAIRSTQSKMKERRTHRGHFLKILILANETSL